MNVELLVNRMIKAGIVDGRHDPRLRRQEFTMDEWSVLPSALQEYHMIVSPRQVDHVLAEIAAAKKKDSDAAEAARRARAGRLHNGARHVQLFSSHRQLSPIQRSETSGRQREIPITSWVNQRTPSRVNHSCRHSLEETYPPQSLNRCTQIGHLLASIVVEDFADGPSRLSNVLFARSLSPIIEFSRSSLPKSVRFQLKMANQPAVSESQ
jgi:hypothetical protein